MSVRIPGQAPIDYIRRDLDLPSPLVTTAQMQDGSSQVHIAGGLGKLEMMALEIAKAYLGGAVFDRERLPDALKVGEWSVAVAETILLKCEELKAVGGELVSG